MGRDGRAGGARGPAWPLPEVEAWGCALSWSWEEELSKAAPQHRGVPEPAHHERPVRSRSTGSPGTLRCTGERTGLGAGVVLLFVGVWSQVVTPAVTCVVPPRGEGGDRPWEYASSAAGTPSGHRGRGGLACAQATEPLPQPDFLPAAFFFALKPPFPRAVSLAGALHEGFGLPAMNGSWGCWWRA